MQKKALLKRFILIILFLYNSISFSQDLLKIPDLSQVKVERLSVDEINQLKSKMQTNNISIEKLEKITSEKGMSPTNFALLKAKLENLTPSVTENIKNEPIVNVDTTKNEPIELKNEIFGSDIFTNPSLTFEPNSNMAIPVNYILGPGDELQIAIYGIQEFATNATVSKEGKISIPNIGQIYVNGLTYEAASTIIKSNCSKIFVSLKSGQSNISISLTKIRTIKVTIIGSKKAGNFSLSSLATVFNALYVAGGPNEKGSYRNIELIRGNKLLKKIDVYKFLISGDQSDNINLKDNDIIRIPVYNCRVSVKGEIKRPGIYELLPNENFNDLLKYCSGFTETAYKSTIKLIQKTDKELKIIDLTKNDYDSYIPRSGDNFEVDEILNRFENKISIKGSVHRPNDYSFYDGLRLIDLINKADGLTEDAYLFEAQITRRQPDFSKEIISVNLQKVLISDSLNNIKLQKEDEVYIFSLYDFKDAKNVQISGYIRKPGYYPYLQNLTLFDVITKAGGYSDNASKKIEISRLIKKDEVVKDQIEIAKIILIDGNELINDPSKDILLEPNDLIMVRKMPIFELQQTVSISGFVEYPGQYTISNKNETVLDLINRAGGLKSDANEKGIYIKRGEFQIPINYSKISKKPISIENIKAQPGDELVILKYIPAIKIIGSVALNTEIPYIKGKSVKYYINRAGGFNPRSAKKNLFNSYANGTAGRTRHFLFFKLYPKVHPGSEIHIPQKPEKEKRNITELVSVASVTTSMATMIAVLSKLFSTK